MDIVDYLGLNDSFRNKYLVNDRRGSDTICVLFILESPHTSEISNGWPAAGTTGEIMSQVILNNSSIPFGQLLDEMHISVQKFAVMNVLQIPMQLSAYEEDYQQKDELCIINSIREYQGKPYDVKKHKAKIQRAMTNDKVVAYILKNFSLRVGQFVNNYRPSLVVVCGVVAQAFFDELLNFEIDFGRESVRTIRKHECNVFYTYHPSPNSGTSESKWFTDVNHINKLKEVIQKVL